MSDRLRPADHAVTTLAAVAGAAGGAVLAEDWSALTGALLGAGALFALALLAYGRRGAALAAAGVSLATALLVYGATGGDTALVGLGSVLLGGGAIVVAAARRPRTE